MSSRVTPVLDPRSSSSRAIISDSYSNLISNAYAVSVRPSDKLVYKYNLSIEPTSECKNISHQILNKTIVAHCLRKLMIEKIIPSISDRTVRSPSCIIDYDLNCIFSLHAFRNKDSGHNESSDISIFRDVEVDCSFYHNLRVNISIRYIKSSNLMSGEFNRDIANAITHHKLLMDTLKYADTYYMIDEISKHAIARHSTRSDLISQQVMGFSISNLKFCSQGPLMVIGCTFTNLTKAFRLIDLLASFIAGRAIDNFRSLSSIQTRGSHEEESIARRIQSIRPTSSVYRSFAEHLRGFKVRSILNGRATILRFRSSDKSAVEQMMSMDKQSRLSVKDFWHGKGVLLDYPNLPCIEYNHDNRIYFPLELCTLIPNQKVPIYRLSQSAQAEQMSSNKPLPQTSYYNSKRVRDIIEHINKEEFSNFGFALSRNQIAVTAGCMPKPTLRFKTVSTTPTREAWRQEQFCRSQHLCKNWAVVNTIEVDRQLQDGFFHDFMRFAKLLGLDTTDPFIIDLPKKEIIEKQDEALEAITNICMANIESQLRLVVFVIDHSESTTINRLVHLFYDRSPNVSATCIRIDSIRDVKRRTSILRTLVPKINARMGGTNVTYDSQCLSTLNLSKSGLLVVGLDVTHPDNELSGVSIVGCAYTFSDDLFRHKSFVWPQKARLEIICKLDIMIRLILTDYSNENQGRLPAHILIYRDGVSHEEFDKVHACEVGVIHPVIKEMTDMAQGQRRPQVTFVIAQKRHSLRFYHIVNNAQVQNPVSGTLIDKDVVVDESREFYLFSKSEQSACARPVHYHVLENSLGMDLIQKLTYMLCFNFGRCSSSVSMPSTLKYAHNAAYDARNRVIRSIEFLESKFYANKFFC